MPKKILLVDYHQRNEIMMSLRRHGYEVTHVLGLKEVARELASETFDMVVSCVLISLDVHNLLQAHSGNRDTLMVSHSVGVVDRIREQQALVAGEHYRLFTPSDLAAYVGQVFSDATASDDVGA